MYSGLNGSDPRQKKEQSARRYAAMELHGWLMGRTHLNDEVDRSLNLVLRLCDSTADQPGKAARNRAGATLREWIAKGPHLPRDLVAALLVLLPEIGQGSMADEWPPG
jgi:hypothetical protein